MKFKVGQIVRYVPNKSMLEANDGPSFFGHGDNDSELLNQRLEITALKYNYQKDKNWIVCKFLDHPDMGSGIFTPDALLSIKSNDFIARIPLNSPEDVN